MALGLPGGMAAADALALSYERNKRTRDTILPRCEHVMHWMGDSAKLYEEVEPGKQSGVTDPAFPCRAVEARP
jgi:hypothetical protein